jgi:hypothetical protein
VKAGFATPARSWARIVAERFVEHLEPIEIRYPMKKPPSVIARRWGAVRTEIEL